MLQQIDRQWAQEFAGKLTGLYTGGILSLMLDIGYKTGCWRWRRRRRPACNRWREKKLAKHSAAPFGFVWSMPCVALGSLMFSACGSHVRTVS